MATESYHRTSVLPVVEPVSLTETKAHLRISGSDEDTVVTNLIKVAREHAETVQGRTFICRTYEMGFDDGFPSIIYPPYPPLVSVSSITYTDTAEATQTVTDTDYTVDTYSSPPRIYEAYGKVWPTGLLPDRNNVVVTYVAGMAAKFTASTADVLTISGRTVEDDEIVRVWNLDGALPTGLAADTDYYVISSTGSTCELSLTSGGVKIDITAVGSGTHYISYAATTVPETVRMAIKLIVGHLYEHREETTEQALQRIPLGAKLLLYQNKVQW